MLRKHSQPLNFSQQLPSCPLSHEPPAPQATADDGDQADLDNEFVEAEELHADA